MKNYVQVLHFLACGHRLPLRLVSVRHAEYLCLLRESNSGVRRHAAGRSITTHLDQHTRRAKHVPRSLSPDSRINLAARLARSPDIPCPSPPQQPLSRGLTKTPNRFSDMRFSTISSFISLPHPGFFHATPVKRKNVRKSVHFRQGMYWTAGRNR